MEIKFKRKKYFELIKIQLVFVYIKKAFIKLHLEDYRAFIHIVNVLKLLSSLGNFQIILMLALKENGLKVKIKLKILFSICVGSWIDRKPKYC